jgi:hypothetical protein
VTTLRPSRLAILILAVAACGGRGDSPSPTPSVPPTPTADVALPPVARLSAEGGDAVPGQLGTFEWGDGGSDSPWLPGAPIRVGGGEPLLVAFEGDPAIESWTARRLPVAAVPAGDPDPLGGGEAVVTFASPAAGSWSVGVTVRFAGGGTATYYWRLDVA